MTILQINKFYYPHRGAEMVMLELSKLLESHGHTVVPFAMASPQNLPTPYAHSFVSNVNPERVRFDFQGLRVAGRMLYSFEAKRKLAGLIKTTKPEIAHIHNIYQQISPSILDTLRHAKIPTVMTVHDFALISPSYSLFDHGAICERALVSPWKMIEHKCIKNSAVASAWSALVFSLHRALKLYERGIDRFISPSEFVKNKLVHAGMDEKKIEVVPHFFDATRVTPSYVGDYVGYIGALSLEKGVLILLEAARQCSEIQFKIAGTGPDQDHLRKFVERHNLRNVEFVGRLDGIARDRFYRNAMMLVVPSIWYEVFGLVILEAYAAGKPVIVSRIGGLPEVVREGETGFLFDAGDHETLGRSIRMLANDADRRKTMGEAARRLVETEYAPERHYERMMNLYNSVIANTSSVIARSKATKQSRQ